MDVSALRISPERHTRKSCRRPPLIEHEHIRTKNVALAENSEPMLKYVGIVSRNVALVVTLVTSLLSVAVAVGRLRGLLPQHSINLNQASVEPVVPIAPSISFGVKSVSRL